MSGRQTPTCVSICAVPAHSHAVFASSLCFYQMLDWEGGSGRARGPRMRADSSVSVLLPRLGGGADVPDQQTTPSFSS